MSAAFDRRRLLRMIALLAVAWAAILIGLASWQRSRPAGARAEPQLLHYPGAEQVQEQTAPNLGLRKYWFRLNEDYPSKSVYYFYQDQLEAIGWQRLGTGEPQWVRRVESNLARDLFQAVWVSPDHLFQVELEMMSLVRPANDGSSPAGQEREPGIQVFVTLRRVLHPGIIIQPRAAEGGDNGINPGH
jgi:hypothetical protein